MFFICHAIRISPFCSNPPPAPSNAGAGFLETTKYPWESSDLLFELGGGFFRESTNVLAMEIGFLSKRMQIQASFTQFITWASTHQATLDTGIQRVCNELQRPATKTIGIHWMFFKSHFDLVRSPSSGHSKIIDILWMEEILHQLIDGLSHYL